jgi:hypothetical protein
MADFDPKRLTVLVYDSGIFVEIARRLAEDFGRVLYFAPWASGYPTSRGLLIGGGDETIERVTDPWPFIENNEIDLYVFPDCYEGDLQSYLASQGKRVWGCRRGAELELDRPKAKEIMAKAGIPIGDYKEIIGLDALRKYLKTHEDHWIKINSTRGDMETFHSPTYEKIEPRLDELEHNLGAKKKIMKFIVEKGISDATETGYDGFCIDGQFPRVGLVGIEVKDKGYVGRTIKYADLPEQVRTVNDGLKPALKGYNYRGFWSTEVRIDKNGVGYPIDMTARAGSPPSELYQNMITNLAEVIWFGAEGIMIEPEYSAPWGAEVILHCEWADKNWAHITFPPELRRNVKLRNYTVIEGEHYIVPQLCGMPEVGAVVATGKTAAEAIKEAKRIAGLVEGYYLEAPVEVLDEALADLKEILGAKGESKPASEEQTAAEAALKSGKISQRQFDKLADRNDWT